MTDVDLSTLLKGFKNPPEIPDAPGGNGFRVWVVFEDLDRDMALISTLEQGFQNRAKLGLSKARPSSAGVIDVNMIESS